jgi:hypothetical protein
MKNGTHKQFGPVCRFGPGGDFVSIWPASLESQPSLGKSRCAFEDVEAKKPAHQLSAMFGKGHPFSGQPVLFPDDDQIGLKVSQRPAIRAVGRRRTTGKHFRVDVDKQYLLFATIRQAQDSEQSQTAAIKIARTA